MNNNQQSYHRLIAQLRHCAGEAEVKQVLNSYLELNTSELLEVMAQEVEGLRDNMDWDGANSLLSLALEVGDVLGSSEREVSLRKEIGDFLSKMGRREYEVSQFSWAVQFYELTLRIYREIKDRPGEVDAINGLGNSYRFLRERERATALFQESLAIAREIEYGQGEVDGLYGLGAMEHFLGEYESAKAYVQEALTIAEAIGYTKGKANAFDGLGHVCGGLGEYEEAINFYQQSLPIFREIKDRKEEASVLNNLGAAYYSLGKYETAINFYQQSLRICQELKYRKGEAYVLNNLGLDYNSLGQYETAINFFQQSLPIYREIKDRKEEANVLKNLDDAYYSLGQHKRRIDVLKQSLPIKQELKDRKGEASVLNNLGVAYHHVGQYEKAINFYQQSLSINQELKDREGEANVLNNLGYAYDNWGQYETAINFYQQSLPISRKIKNREYEVCVLNNLGVAYYKLAQYERAINSYQRSLPISREIKNREYEVCVLNNLGDANYYLGQHQEAIDLYHKSLAISQKYQYRWAEADSRNGLGRIYYSQEKYQPALEFYQECFAIKAEIGDIPGEAKGRTNVALAYKSLQEPQRAIEFLQQSLEIFQQISDPEGQADCQNHLGVAYQDLKQHQQARNHYQASLEIATPEGMPTICLNAGQNYGHLEFQENNWSAAIAPYQKAIEAAEILRVRSLTDNRRQKVMIDAIEIYANTIQCHINLQQYDLALEYTERYRCKQLVDLIASKDLYQDEKMPEKVRNLMQEFEKLQGQIENIRDRDTREDSNNNRSSILPATRYWRAQNEIRNKSIIEKEIAKRKILEQIRKQDPVIAQGIQVAHLKFSQLQQLINNEHSAILSFYSTKTDTHIFILRQNSIQLHSCPQQGRDNLQQWLKENWFNLYVPDKNKNDNENKENYQKWQQQMPDLLAELANRLNIQKLIQNHLEDIEELILIPHQQLHLIPLGALPISDSEYLHDKYLIRTLASCQILSFCQDRVQLQTAPTYGIVENTQLDLPFSQLEAETVAQLCQVSPDKHLQGAEATVPKYRELLKQINRLLSSHHAVSRIDNNLESALMLAENQKITLGELLTPAYRFPELEEVFLSCCETNLGTPQPTDDMLTLNTGFLSAGARGVISTLWEVDDLASCIFSIIYHRLRAEGIDRVRAVQKTQQTMVKMTEKQLQQEIKTFKKQQKKRYKRELEALTEEQRDLETQEPQSKDSPEYQAWKEKLNNAIQKYVRKDQEQREFELRLKEARKREYPFSHPVYWSSFICAGLRD